VRALEALSGQEGQEDQNSPLLLNFLLPPSRPLFPLPTPTTPPKRNRKASSPASTSSTSSSSPPDAVIRNNKRDVALDEFPHPYQRLSDGSYSLLDCWHFHGRSQCPVCLRYRDLDQRDTNASARILVLRSPILAHLIPILPAPLTLLLPHPPHLPTHCPIHHQLRHLTCVPCLKVGSPRHLALSCTPSLPLLFAHSFLLL
jgi:hypothetical protein